MYLVSVVVKVYHSSAFQTISVRSVYIKIINHSGSILANLSNKTTYNEKPHSYSNSGKIYKGLFLWWKDLKQKMFKTFSFSLLNKLELCSIYLYFLRCCFFKKVI